MLYTADVSLGHIGRYELLQPLGRGGMAEVYLARPCGDPRSVVYALKSILPHFADDPRFVQMFHRELTIATGLCHPNLVSVLDHGREHGRHFMVMEYVHGPDLAKLLRSAGEHDVQPPLDAAVSIVLAVARGLHHLHEWPGKHGGTPGFVHRDVSPSNVLVGYDGVVKVTDFGVATASSHTRTTEAGGVKGKMGYLSPEQCRSEGLDRRSDVYALGVLLYEATLGERLFYGDNDYAVMHQIVSSDYDRPSDRDPNYPPELEAIILTALAEDREDRFSTAESFADALEAFAEQSGLSIGSETIANWVASLVPWQPYPAFAPPTLIPSGPSTAVTTASAPPPRRGSNGSLGLIAALAVPAVLGVAIAALIVSGSEEDVPTPAKVQAETEAPRPVAQPAPVPQPVAAAQPGIIEPGIVEPDLEPGVIQDPPQDPSGGEAAFEDAFPDGSGGPVPEGEAFPEDADASPEASEEALPDDTPSENTKRRRKKRRRRKAKQRRPGYDLDAPRPPQ